MEVINLFKTGNDWEEILQDEVTKEYYQQLRRFLISEYRNYTIYPAMNDIFNALKATSYADTKVVILGQDPYHEPGQAHGMAFSVRNGVRWPPSLMNIFREIQHEDIGVQIFTDENRKRFSGRSGADKSSGCLSRWADQGVLLLNTTLTVREHKAGSHRGHGWEIFTDNIIRKLNEHREPIVFILWGRNARDKKRIISAPHHLVLEGAHPSPLSAYKGFFGGEYFAKANKFLQANDIRMIDWNI